MKQIRLLTLLVLLMTAATGAWADETPLVTIENKDYTSFTNESKTFDDKVTVTFSNLVYNFGDESGWTAGGNASLLTVAGTNGYTITSCKFYTKDGIAKTGYTVEGESPSVYLQDGTVYIDDSKSVNIGTLGVTKIEVYGAAPAGYTVSMKDDVKDADKWTITPNPAEEGQTVTLQYNGRLKVKGVKATSDAAPAANSVDLSTLTADYEAQDGEVLTGTLGANVKISIADGATVTLKNLSINASGTCTSGNHAGITCPGNATISLEGTNTVKGFYEDYPGIHIAKGKTLYIKGSGTLNAIGGGYGAGIGAGYDISCGNIEIQDGTVNAQGGKQSAGIGSGVYYSSSSDCGTITISGGTVNATGGVSASGIGSGEKGTCSDITISGGTVNAKGGENNSGVGTGAGIGSGKNGTCGNITIANTVTKVTATSSNAPHSIGKGTDGTCGTVTIGGTKYWENNAAVNGGDTYLATSPLIYQPSN